MFCGTFARAESEPAGWLVLSCICSRCSCDECNIVRLVASGIVSPELTDQLSHDGAVTVTPTPSYCFADMLPQMLTVGAGDAHQLPMMFGPIAEYVYFYHNCHCIRSFCVATDV